MFYRSSRQSKSKPFKNTPWVAGVEPDITIQNDDAIDDEQLNENGSLTASDAEDKQELNKRDTVIEQHDAWDDLRFLSGAKTAETAENERFRLARSYLYFSTAGAGGWIYLIDTGLNPQHDEFGSIGSIRWLFAVGAKTSKSDPQGHGTSMASKILGRDYLAEITGWPNSLLWYLRK